MGLEKRLECRILPKGETAYEILPLLRCRPSGWRRFFLPGMRKACAKMRTINKLKLQQILDAIYDDDDYIFIEDLLYYFEQFSDKVAEDENGEVVFLPNDLTILS